MALAIGCSLLASAVPMIARNLDRESTCSLQKYDMAATLGTPCVMVPVLSKTIVFTCNKNKNMLYVCVVHRMTPTLPIWSYREVD